MKKTYLSILTLIIMGLGIATQAWANNYVHIELTSGNWSDWDLGSGDYMEPNVTTTGTFAFTIVQGSTAGTHYKNDGTMTRNSSTGWKFETNKNNAHITFDVTGKYKFKLEWKDNLPYLTVTYPETTKRTVYLDLSQLTAWEGDNAIFKVWDNNGNHSMTKINNDCYNSHVYSAEVNTIATNYTFKRCSNEGTTWDETSLKITSSNNACQVTSWGSEHKSVSTAITYTQRYTVIFNNHNHGSNVVDRCIQNGQSTTDPASSEAGWTCNGWFTDSQFKNQFIFGTSTITGPTTLHAKWTENPYEVTLTGFNEAKTTAYISTTGSATLKVPTGKKYKDYTATNVTNVSVDGTSVTFNATAAGSLVANYDYLVPGVSFDPATATYQIGSAAIKLNPKYSDLADDAAYTWSGENVTFTPNANVANPNVSSKVEGNHTVTVTVKQGDKQNSANITLTVNTADNKCATCFPQTGSTAQ